MGCFNRYLLQYLNIWHHDFELLSALVAARVTEINMSPVDSPLEKSFSSEKLSYFLCC